MGIGGLSNLSITSLIMVGAGDVESLAGGHNLCMAGVLSTRGFNMRMGGLLCSGLAGGDTVSGALVLQGCGLGSGFCSVSLSKRRVQRLWIAANLSGGASWTLLMASARQRVASKMQLVAVMTRTGIA
jgi:hypothetical protein